MNKVLEELLAWKEINMAEYKSENRSKKVWGILLIAFILMCVIQLLNNNLNYGDATETGNIIVPNSLIPGGVPVGIYMDTDGVMVIDTQEIKSLKGDYINPASEIILPGDYIIKLNDTVIETKHQLVDEVKKLDGGSVFLVVRRGEEILEVSIQPVQDNYGDFKLGLWVRDNLQGLGTLTYVDVNGNFGALGHGIHDMDTSELLEITNGELYRASISGIIKGESGSPGGLEGIIIYNRFNNVGIIEINDASGIYGTVNSVTEIGIETKALPVASISEMGKGEATIYCTVENEVKEYQVEILKINKYESEVNKGIVLQITDPELIEKTGGIVQGMSGSPIIQNGKIIGAVTHVMVNDPTKGYGIFIENMLEMSESINN